MSRDPYAVLFLCTGNSARSILAESILNQSGGGRFRGFSAGSHPAGRVNPHALKLLESLGHPVGELRSKSWDDFTGEGAPAFDFVITVCDNAAGEVCPVWLGHPSRAHWGIADPAAATGSDAEVALAFAMAYRQLKTRIDLFTSLPFASLDAMSLRSRLDEIGKVEDAAEPA